MKEQLTIYSIVCNSCQFSFFSVEWDILRHFWGESHLCNGLCSFLNSEKTEEEKDLCHFTVKRKSKYHVQDTFKLQMNVAACPFAQHQGATTVIWASNAPLKTVSFVCCVAIAFQRACFKDVQQTFQQELQCVQTTAQCRGISTS